MRKARLLTVITLIALLTVTTLTGCFSRNKAPESIVSNIPYKDGAVYTYEIQSQAGDKLGEATFATSRTTYNDQDAWKYTNHTDIPGSVTEDSAVYANATTLEPIRFETTMQIPQGKYEITADYGDKEIKIDAKTPNGPQSVTRPHQENAYDNDQLLMFIRALPLEKDYKTDFTVITPKNANRTAISVRVMDQEKVTVPAGDFDAFKVQLSFQTGAQYAWYAVDGTRPMVKYDNGGTVFLLTDIKE